MMDVVERSSSNDLSSVPNSDTETPVPGQISTHDSPNTITVSRDGISNNRNTTLAPPLRGGGSKDPTTPGTGDRQDSAPKQRKPRKKKDSDATATAPAEKKEKATRRSRGGSTTAASSRKKLKTETIEAAHVAERLQPSPETSYARSLQQSVLNLAGRQGGTPTYEAAKISQNGFLNDNSSMQSPKSTPPQYNPTPPAPPQPAAPPASVRAAYDPVRSAAISSRLAESPQIVSTPHLNISTPVRSIFNPSTSPAISSIINPPEISIDAVKSTAPPYSSHPPQSDSCPPSNVSVANLVKDSPAMEIDGSAVKTETAKETKKTTPEAAATKAVPKPRAKEPPPPLPTGSGLLSSSLFGGDSGMDSKQDSTDKGTSIVLHVDLKNPNNKVINFARMAEEKYGFAALYPRQAAQKERLAKVAAAGAALERAGSGTKGTPAGESEDEDVSVDIDRDSDNDGDVVMTGMNGTGEAVNSGTDGPAPKRRRRKDEYDADDPFVDDSEMLWEAQAAASKDGFFVYCGPLVPEGEKPTVERADGTVKRGRGRGRGGGPGSRGGRGAAAAAARDAEGGGSTRGGGPGSRGGGVTRKPRITKAERQQREQEKKQREQMAVLAAKPVNYQT